MHEFLGVMGTFEIGIILGSCFRGWITNSPNQVMEWISSNLIGVLNEDTGKIAFVAVALIYVVEILRLLCKQPRRLRNIFLVSIVCGVFIEAFLGTVNVVAILIGGCVAIGIIIMVVRAFFSSDIPYEYHSGRIGEKFFDFFKFKF